MKMYRLREPVVIHALEYRGWWEGWWAVVELPESQQRISFGGYSARAWLRRLCWWTE